MREFDYFREEAFFEPANKTDVLQMRVDRGRRNLRVHGALIGVVTIAVFLLALGFRDVYRYHTHAEPAIDLGQAEEMEGKEWPVGHYVKIRGITENRGAMAHFMRGLDWSQDYWYVHLVGSPLVVELPASLVKGKMEPFQEIKVEGRLLEVHKAKEYDKVFHFLQNSLMLNLPEPAYLLQGSMKPDQGLRYLGFFALLAAIPIINILVWWRARQRVRGLQAQLRAQQQ